MNDRASSSSLLGDALLEAITAAVKQAIRDAGLDRKSSDLLEPEELAAKLKVPVSWVYEQRRQGNIPTHRLGRYIRFDFEEVLAARKKN